MYNRCGNNIESISYLFVISCVMERGVDMIQRGKARLYDETEHFACRRMIYESEGDKKLYVMRKKGGIRFFQIPDTWKVEFLARV